MSSVRYAGFTLRTECTSCGMPLPLGPPSRQVVCSQCQTSNTIPKEAWQETLRVFDDLPAPGKVRNHNDSVAGIPLQIQVINQPPSCEKCGTAFPVADLPPGANHSFACVGCGDPASSFPAPDWLQSLESAVKQIVAVDPLPAEQGTAEAAAVDLEAPRPVAMSCSQCGGALQITTEHARVTPCQYCQTDIFLPDAVWKRLHPVRQVQWWYARFEGPTSSVRALHSKQQAAQRSQAEQQARLERERLQEEANQEAKKQKKVDRAEPGLKLVPWAWFGLLLLFLLQAVTVARLVNWITFPSDLTIVLSAYVVLSLSLVTAIGYPLRVTAGAKDVPLKTIFVGALFTLIPAGGGVLAIFIGGLVLSKKSDPDRPHVPAQHPVGAAFVVFGIGTCAMFAILVF